MEDGVEIAAWLRELRLECYEQAFCDNHVDLGILTKLTADDLVAIGVSSVGHRRSLLDAIAALRGTPAAAETVEIRPKKSEAERRQLTVLFCDLVGSTELSGRLDPEDMGRVIRAYQGACTKVVEHWGGHVAKYMGDGVLAYFGWPQAHEDEAERSVRSGLAMIKALAELETPAGTPLAARMGIATGLVMVGELIGEGAAQEQTVVGETPNLAARLQALAAPGSVLISQATRRLVGGPTSAPCASRASPRRCRPGGSKARVVPKAGSRRCMASISRRWSGASRSSPSYSSVGRGPRTATAR
jgi:class 3 adenylate cyclase